MRPRSRRPKTVRCRVCKKVIKVKSKGPLPLYCSATHRQQSHQRRKYSGMMLALAQDIATTKVRDVIREEILSMLMRAGIIKTPPPPPERKKRASHLRVI
jgi:hypothetical protein